MSLPQDIDYLSLPVSLSQEVREILDRVRPSTVSLNVQSICSSFLVFFFPSENVEIKRSFCLPEQMNMQLILCFVLQLGAATRLEGVTPAAIVNLLNYVNFGWKKEKRTHRNQTDQRDEREEELCARNASLPQ